MQTSRKGEACSEARTEGNRVGMHENGGRLAGWLAGMQKRKASSSSHKRGEIQVGR